MWTKTSKQQDPVFQPIKNASFFLVENRLVSLRGTVCFSTRIEAIIGDNSGINQ